MRGELVSLPGKALAAQTLSLKGREERVEGDGSDVLICAFTRDPLRSCLPLPRVHFFRGLGYFCTPYLVTGVNTFLEGELIAVMCPWPWSLLVLKD